MLLRTLFLAAIVTMTTAAPIAKSFEADSMLAVGTRGASSYASKRETFEADSMLAVGAEAVSSYAAKRGTFEAGPMLAVSADETSSSYV